MQRKVLWMRPHCPTGFKDAAKTYVGFEKGVAEGVWAGAKDMVSAAQSENDMLTGVALAKG
jgi:hypothetical protein